MKNRKRKLLEIRRRLQDMLMSVDEEVSMLYDIIFENCYDKLLEEIDRIEAEEK